MSGQCQFQVLVSLTNGHLDTHACSVTFVVSTNSTNSRVHLIGMEVSSVSSVCPRLSPSPDTAPPCALSFPQDATPVASSLLQFQCVRI